MLRLCLALAIVAGAAQPPVTRIDVGGVSLSYVEQGQGDPLILLHGGQGDYRAWSAHMSALSQRFRVIAYSRRHHFPNSNPTSRDYSARVDAIDLGKFIAALKLGPVHLVGTSYGALVALTFALDNPAQVRSLVLAEPPVLDWANDLPGGREMYAHFMDQVHRPAGRAFAAGRDDEALRLLIDEFDGPGAFDRLPADRQLIVRQNAEFFRAVTASADPFPSLDRAAVRRLAMPLLVLHGEKTDALHRMLAVHLAALVPQARIAVIPGAGHGAPRQNASAFTQAVMDFLVRLPQH